MAAIPLSLVQPRTSRHDNQPDAKLATMAKKLWPDSENYQRQWIRSVQFLRAGRGWVLEGAKVDWHANKL